MLIFISIATFATVAFLVFYLTQPRTEAVRRRILAGAPPNDLSRQRTAQGSAATRLALPVARKVGSLLSRILPQNFVRHTDALLLQAGEPLRTAQFLSIWLFSASLTIFLAFRMTQVLASASSAILIVLCTLLVTYGVVLPYAVVATMAENRKKKTEKALPDALDLLLTCVEAGLGIDAGFALVAQRTKGPLAEKLTEYLKQVGLGRSKRDALEDIAQRSGAKGLLRLAAIVTQSGAVGTSMGDVLRIQAAELRESRRLKAKEAAARAPILMTIPLALCFLPAMGAVIVVPTILHFIESVGEVGLLG